MRLVTSRDLVHHHDARAARYGALAEWLSGEVAPLPLTPDHPVRALPAENGAASPAAARVTVAGTAEALRTLAYLARETARALHRDDLSGAAALLAAQSDFLDVRVIRGLRETCARLVATGDPAAQAVATSLSALLDDDGTVPGRHLESIAGDGVVS